MQSYDEYIAAGLYVQEVCVVLHGEQSPGISDYQFYDKPVDMGVFGEIPMSRSNIATGYNQTPQLSRNFNFVSELEKDLGCGIIITEFTAPGGVFMSNVDINDDLRRYCLSNPNWRSIVANAALELQRKYQDPDSKEEAKTTPKGFAESGESGDPGESSGTGLIGTQIHEYTSSSKNNMYYDHIVQTMFNSDEARGEFSVRIPPLDKNGKIISGKLWPTIITATDPFLVQEHLVRSVRISDLMKEVVKRVRKQRLKKLYKPMKEEEDEEDYVEKMEITDDDEEEDDEEVDMTIYRFNFVMCNPPIDHQTRTTRIKERLVRVTENTWQRIQVNSFDMNGTIEPAHAAQYWKMVFYTDLLRYIIYSKGKNLFLKHASYYNDNMMQNVTNNCSLMTDGRFAIMDDDERRDFLINVSSYLTSIPYWISSVPPLHMHYFLQVSTTPTFKQINNKNYGNLDWGISQITKYPAGTKGTGLNKKIHSEYIATLSKGIFPKLVRKIEQNVNNNQQLAELYYNLTSFVNQKGYPFGDFLLNQWKGSPTDEQMEIFIKLPDHFQKEHDKKSVSSGTLKMGGKKKRKKPIKRSKKSSNYCCAGIGCPEWKHCINVIGDGDKWKPKSKKTLKIMEKCGKRYTSLGDKYKKCMKRERKKERKKNKRKTRKRKMQRKQKKQQMKFKKTTRKKRKN